MACVRRRACRRGCRRPAGSASCAEIGSALAAQAAIKKATELLQRDWPRTETGWHALLERVFDESRRSVLRNAVMMELERREFATTLLLAIATPDELVAGQVGDGAVVARRQDGSFARETRGPIRRNTSTKLPS